MRSYLDSRRGLGIRPGLDTTLALLERLGNPHRDFSSVLIGGTNGKGSVAAMLHSILVESGYRAGLYTSPHLLDFRERIRVNRSLISGDELAEGMRKVRAASHGLDPTFFEVATAAAFLHFSMKGVDLAVVEVGMGGRWDATNCLAPEFSVITSLDVDHADFLGDSLEKIAGEKAGIAGEGGLLITSNLRERTGEVLRRICREREARIREVSRNFDAEILSMNLTGSVCRVCLNRRATLDIKIPLAGAHQVENARLAIASALELRDGKWDRISDAALARGIEETVWRGRLETVARDPNVVLDVAHNPEAARVLAAELRELFEFSCLVFILNIRKNKNIPLIVQELARISNAAFVIRPDAERDAEPGEIVRAFHEEGKEAEAAGNFAEAFSAAKTRARERGLICVTGSFGAVAEAYRALGIRV